MPITSKTGTTQERNCCQKKQKAQSRFSWSSITLDTWFLERAFLVFSIACLIAIYGILFAYNGKPRPEFFYNISLNAIVSVIATACKSSLIFVVGAGLSQLKWVWFQNRRKLSSIQGSSYITSLFSWRTRHIRSLYSLIFEQAFEDASRGPMGSISFLFRHQGQSIASLGATILILMLAFEPFVQQILSYPTEQILTEAETLAAAAPRAQFWDPKWRIRIQYSAYYRGIWTEDFNINATCPSGECTWPSYKSLGLCSQCSNVTSVATLNCAMPPSSHKATQNATMNGTCEVVLPQGRPSGTGLEAAFRNDTPCWMKYSMDAVWEVEDSPVLDGSAYSGVENPLIVMAQSTLGFDGTRITNLSDPTEGIFIKTVTQCAFNLCVKEYNLRVTNGISVLEKSLPDFGKTENLTGPEINGKSSLLCWMPHQIPNDIERHYDVLHETDWPPLPLAPELSFCDLEKYGEDIFTGSLLAGSTVDTCMRFDSEWIFAQRVAWGLDMFNRILALGLDIIGSRVADSMTKAFLQNSNITVPGSIYTNQVMVRVQWAWMVLPTLLVILGIVFLAGTTYASRKKVIWKSSILAFLFHGLEDQKEQDNCMTSSGMEKLAETMHVQLHPSQDDARVILRENQTQSI